MDYCENIPKMPTATIFRIPYGKTPKLLMKHTKLVRLLKLLYSISVNVTKGNIKTIQWEKLYLTLGISTF